ncbi:MAG TPA: hypothetical protein VKA67_07255, partial [Verrucomicrobiae bacterium]|nr:hypothetical protein [Verrucomicrobiae bacterium]
MERLRNTLVARGVAAMAHESLEQAPVSQECVLVAGRASDSAHRVFEAARISLSHGPECLAMARAKIGKRTVLAVAGSDARGLVYALLELADRVNFAADPLAALNTIKPVSEQPANKVRSVARAFVSDVEDMSWFRDRAFWSNYLTMLAGQRFNRFSLTFGIGYDFTTDISDCYFHFAYPFLLSV